MGLKESTMRTKILLLAGLLLIVTITEAHATQDRDKLKGLSGVLVVIEALNPDLERGGVAQAQLKTRVEVKLRQAGIRVLTPTEFLTIPDSAYLYLNLTSVQVTPDRPIYALFLSLEVHEPVIIRRNKETSFGATTWNTGKLLVFSTTRSIQDRLGDLVDEFINDYLAANPK
jgi:hypothetical protein